MRILLMFRVISIQFCWAEDPDFSDGVLTIPSITINKTVTFYNIELDLDLAKKSVSLKKVDTDIIIRIRSLLNAGQKVPASTSSGSGIAVLKVNRKTRAIIGNIWLNNLKDVTAAHIHTGAADKTGPVIIGLQGYGDLWTIPEETVLTEEQFQNLLAGNLYINVHTKADPAGEIRGQIEVKTTFKRFITHLAGWQEVPSSVETTAKGVAMLKLDLSTGIITGKIKLFDLSDVTGSHIHVGEKGTNGPVVVTLTGDDSVRNIPDNTKLTPEQMAQLLKGLMYYNVHTSTNPSGEIRGQIRPILK